MPHINAILSSLSVADSEMDMPHINAILSSLSVADSEMDMPHINAQLLGQPERVGLPGWVMVDLNNTCNKTYNLHRRSQG